jgi:hypothetical protein
VGTAYAFGHPFRGLEFGVGDLISVSGDLRTLTVDMFSATSGADQLRVITAPAPAAGLLAGALAVGLFSRRRVRPA